MGVPLRLRLSESEDPHTGTGVAEPQTREGSKYASSSRGCQTAGLIMSGYAARTTAAPPDTGGHAMDVALRLRLPESEVCRGTLTRPKALVSPNSSPRRHSKMRHRAAAEKLQRSS